MLVILPLILLYLNTGYADTDTDLSPCVVLGIEISMSLIHFFLRETMQCILHFQSLGVYLYSTFLPIRVSTSNCITHFIPTSYNHA